MVPQYGHDVYTQKRGDGGTYIILRVEAYATSEHPGTNVGRENHSQSNLTFRESAHPLHTRASSAKFLVKSKDFPRKFKFIWGSFLAGEYMFPSSCLRRSVAAGEVLRTRT